MFVVVSQRSQPLFYYSCYIWVLFVMLARGYTQHTRHTKEESIKKETKSKEKKNTTAPPRDFDSSELTVPHSRREENNTLHQILRIPKVLTSFGFAVLAEPVLHAADNGVDLLVGLVGGAVPEERDHVVEHADIRLLARHDLS
jgi:hypothetical protein